MRRLLTFTLVGFLAQMIDGALGMAYGASSATFLVTAGYAPALVSSSVHLAEVGTTLVSGFAHWRFGNVDWTVVRRIALPGGVGAFVGATVLSSVDGDTITPWTATILLGLGLIVLARFAFGIGAEVRGRQLTRIGGAGVGLAGGFVDAIGGGGWGPIATPTLLTATDLEPRRVIGSVDTSEFVVSVAASAGFLIGIGAAGIDGTVVVALLAGGVVAAPVAAWLVRRLSSFVLGVGVGCLLLLTNARTLVRHFDVDGRSIYPPLVIGLVLVLLWALRRRQRGSQASSSTTRASTDVGSSPAARSAIETSSSTDRNDARTATHSDTRDSMPS